MNISETIATMKENIKSDRETAAMTAMVDLAYRTIQKSRKANLSDDDKVKLYPIAKIVRDEYEYACGTLYDLNRGEKLLGFIALVVTIELLGVATIFGICAIPGINSVNIPEAVLITIIAVFLLALTIGVMAIALKYVGPWIAEKKCSTRAKRMEKFLNENEVAYQIATMN